MLSGVLDYMRIDSYTSSQAVPSPTLLSAKQVEVAISPGCRVAGGPNRRVGALLLQETPGGGDFRKNLG